MAQAAFTSMPMTAALFRCCHMVQANAGVTFPVNPLQKVRYTINVYASLWAGGLEAKESQVHGTESGFVSLTGQKYHCIPQGVDKERKRKSNLKHQSRWKFSLLHAMTSCCFLAFSPKRNQAGKKWGTLSFDNWPFLDTKD